MSLEKYVSFATKSFSLPDICIRIRTLLDDPCSSANDIGELISLDSSLSAKVLRLANSSLFRFPSQVDSIAKAVNIIGGEALYNIVVAETANSAFRYFDTQLINLDKHWFESVYCGIVGKYLARASKIRGSERFFAMGILQNLSELVVAKRSPELYKNYLEQETDMQLEERQIAHFGFTFSNCSGNILENWKLPLVLYYPVMHANDVGRQASDRDIALLALATKITAIQQSKKSIDDIELFSEDEANSIDVDMYDIANAIKYADRETAKISMLIH
ncbi:HDOD domain-containing protein [Alteromonas sp. 1_MG-2023]|uniref:HDOD domain-containing protein n=1 Tax=Alteromonas sp. 1_MG-2023 TaxID=3062669 RepID=UPI0026E24B16|nr:HDOD domain-containing protein [Alteromonas sp. 1_MG-2023]MDO6568638.1 HDOD domain-containing protein [Alteromonas sp. 1_MG-2023]